MDRSGHVGVQIGGDHNPGTTGEAAAAVANPRSRVQPLPVPLVLLPVMGRRVGRASSLPLVLP
eukprot:9331094-Pyramimonas_sp.AAC.1